MTHKRFWIAALSVVSLWAADASQKVKAVQKTELNPEEGAVVDFANLKEINTLYQALLSAYSNNPELVALRHEFKYYLEGIKQAQAGFFPRVQTDASVTSRKAIETGTLKDIANVREGAHPGGTETSNQSVGLTVTQNLFSGWASLEALKSADYQVQAVAFKMKNKEQEVFMQVIEVFLEILRLNADIEATTASHKAYAENVEVSNNRMKIGEETHTQVALAQTRLSDVESRLQILKATRESMHAAFISLTGCRLAAKPVNPKFPDSDLKKLQTLLTKVDSNLEVCAAEAQYRYAKHEINKEKGAWYPTVDLQLRSSYDIGHNNLDYTTMSQSYVQRNTNHQVTLSVKYDIFNGGASVSKINQAHAGAASRKVQIDVARFKVRQEMVKAFENFSAAALNIKSFETQVDAARVALDGTRQEMLAGVRILVDVLQRQGELLEAQQKLINARKSYMLEGFRLMSLVGRLNVDRLSLPIKAYPADQKHDAIKSNIPNTHDA